MRHAERDRALSKRVLAGDVIVLRPGIPTETTLEGDAEVVQIFIEPESLGRVAGKTVTGTLVAPAGDALKRAVVQLFVSARHDDWRGCRAAEARLRQEVRDLLTAPARRREGTRTRIAAGGNPRQAGLTKEVHRSRDLSIPSRSTPS